MSVYQKIELKEQSFFQKLFKQFPKENYIYEIQNLLAENENDLLSIDIGQVSKLQQKYKVGIQEFQQEREFLLNEYIDFCLVDKSLSNDEMKILYFLSDLLNITYEYMNTRIEEEGKIIYREKILSVISDNKIDDDERNELSKLRSEFNLSDDVGKAIYSEETQKKIQEYVNFLIVKRRISPDEEKKLYDLLKDLNVSASFTGDGENGIKKLRLYWDVENADLPVLQSPINLKKGETLHYTSRISWHEERSRTRTVSYGGISTSFRVCKGVYLRSGRIAPSRETEAYMKLIDVGTVYFTNKRIIFMGNHGNKTIPYSKILSFTPCRNGIEIGKDTGKSPFFGCDDPEMMGIFLARLINEC